jgi:hypothetical protein
MKSGFLNLNFKDLSNGIVVAVLLVITQGIYTILDAGSLPTVQQLLDIAVVAGKAAVAYLAKNFLTNSKDELLKTEA